jgi:hypothetical protein
MNYYLFDIEADSNPVSIAKGDEADNDDGK